MYETSLHSRFSKMRSVAGGLFRLRQNKTFLKLKIGVEGVGVIGRGNFQIMTRENYQFEFLSKTNY